MKKKIMIAGLAAAVTLGMTSTVWAGEWKSNEKGWWYEKENGDYMTGFMVEIDGKWYSFGENGYMVTGWLPDKGEWYYMDPDGARASGWREIGGKWYFFEKNGLMLRNEWKNQNGKKYYFHDDGSMALGYFEPEFKESDRDDFWYYADPQQGGAIRTSQIDEKNGIKYSASGQVFVRSNEDDKWIKMETIQDQIRIVKDEIEDKYLQGITWADDAYRAIQVEQMENEVRERLGNIVSQEELEEFIEDLGSRISFQ